MQRDFDEKFIEFDYALMIANFREEKLDQHVLFKI